MNDPAFAHNQQILEDLEWAIAANDGEFELFFISSEYELLNNQCLNYWTRNTELNLLKLQLGVDDNRFLSRVRDEITSYQENNSTPPQAIIICDFNRVVRFHDWLANINQSRDELKQTCLFPVIFWIDRSSLQMLLEQARDLSNWSAPVISLQMPKHLLPQVVGQRFTKCLEIFTAEKDNHTYFHQFWTKRYLNDENLFKEVRQIETQISLGNIELEEEKQGQLLFLKAGHFYGNDLNNAKKYYQESLSFFQKANSDFTAIAQIFIGKIFQEEHDFQSAKIFFKSAIQSPYVILYSGLLQLCGVQLGRVLRSLKDWDALEKLATNLLELSEVQTDFGLVSNELRLELNSFLAQIALEKDQYSKAISKILLILDAVESIANQQQHDSTERGLELYGLILAIAYEHQGEHKKSLDSWIRVLAYSNLYYEQLDYFFELIRQLYQLYFNNQHFVDAYKVKLEWRSLEQQYGRIAFVGASRLKPLRRVRQESREDEFAASGRQGDVQLIMERLSRPKHKMTVIYGQSGVGKSSMIDAGLLPAIQQRKFLNGRDLVPVLVRNYGDWTGAIANALPKSFLGEGAEGGRGFHNLSQPTPNPSQEGNELLAYLQQITDQDKLIIIIFDQFEEFFFRVKDPKEQRQFFEFFQRCLNIPFVKIILSLREDYLHLLLQGTRNLDLGAIANNLLDKNIIHHIGNFSPDAAKGVIRFLIDGSEVTFSDELIDIVVEDLTTEFGEVRPIELQIVGQQIQRDIRTKKQYLANRTNDTSLKEILIDRYLEDAIKDCGKPNEQISRLILYYLTDEDEHKVLKSLAELEGDLEQWQEKFQMAEGKIAETLEILVMSGLVVETLVMEVNQYQLVHDYLIKPIRNHQVREFERLKQELESQKNELEKEIKRLKNEQLSITRITQLHREILGANRRLFWQPLDTLLSSLKSIKELSKNTNQSKQENLYLHALSYFQELIDQTYNEYIEYNQLYSYGESVRSICCSPIRNILTSGSTIGTIKLWNLKGKELFRIKGHKDTIYSIVFNPSGEMIASASKDGTIKLWKLHIEGLQLLQSIEECDVPVRSISFSSDGKTLVSAYENGQIKIWELGLIIQEKFCIQAHEDSIYKIIFNPEGNIIASASKDKTIKLWNLEGNDSYKFCAYKLSFSHELPVRSIAFNSKGTILASGSEDGSVKLWDLIENRVIWPPLEHQSRVTDVIFSADNNFIASSSYDGNIRIWNLSDTKQKKPKLLQSHENRIWNLSFSQNQETLVSASDDATIRFWKKSKIQSSSSIVMEHQSKVCSVTFFTSNENYFIASASKDKTIKLYDLQTKKKKEFTGHENTIASVNFSSKTNLLASASDDKTIRLWTLNGKLRKILKYHNDKVWDIDFSPDGKILASASADNTIILWHLFRNTKIIVFRGHTRMVENVKFSPDSTTLASASWDKTVRLWNIESGKETILEHKDIVFSVSFSPDGKVLATASEDKKVRLWNLQNIKDDVLEVREETSIKLEGHMARVWSVTFSPDGQTLASASKDRTVIWWKLTGEMLRIFTGHLDEVTCVDFSPDGKALVSGSKDRTVRMWNVESLDEPLSQGCKLLEDYLRLYPEKNTMDDGEILCEYFSC